MKVESFFNRSYRLAIVEVIRRFVRTPKIPKTVREHEAYLKHDPYFNRPDVFALGRVHNCSDDCQEKDGVRSMGIPNSIIIQAVGDPAGDDLKVDAKSNSQPIKLGVPFECLANITIHVDGGRENAIRLFPAASNADKARRVEP
jgi:hypothetical protein